MRTHKHYANQIPLLHLSKAFDVLLDLDAYIVEVAAKNGMNFVVHIIRVSVAAHVNLHFAHQVPRSHSPKVLVVDVQHSLDLGDLPHQIFNRLFVVYGQSQQQDPPGSLQDALAQHESDAEDE